MKLLIVDDHPEFLKTIAEELSDAGHSVTACLRADDAIKSLDEIALFDCVILDIMMRLGTIIAPDEAKDPGIAIYKRIRSKRKDIPVIVISAKSKDRFWECSGMDADKHASYIGKPVPADIDLSEVIKKSV